MRKRARTDLCGGTSNGRPTATVEHPGLWWQTPRLLGLDWAAHSSCPFRKLPSPHWFGSADPVRNSAALKRFGSRFSKSELVERGRSPGTPLSVENARRLVQGPALNLESVPSETGSWERCVNNAR